MPVLLSYRNQSIGLLCKSTDWFLYEGNTCIYWVKANPSKSHLLLTSKEEVSITIKNTTIKNSSSKKLLRVLIDNKLTFKDHVSKLCEKASQKIHALDVFNTCFEYPSVWMFHS